MKQYASSTATLRMLLADPSLQREHVEQTMEAMADASAAYREVEDVIRLGNEQAATDAGIDESELEAELASLVEDVKREEKERRETEEAQDKAAKLPSVPQAEPEREREGSESESREAAEEGKVSPLTEAKSAPHEVAAHETS